MDDIIYTSSSDVLINQFKLEMMKTFEMSDLGELNYFLGLQFKQEPDGIFIKQKNYIENLLQQLNMKNCKLVSTPMGVSVRSQGNSEIEFDDPRKYRGLIGKLLYLTHTRPDICYSLSYLSRYLNCPSTKYFSAAKCVVRYLPGTKELGMWFSRGDEGELEAFLDSDWWGGVHYLIERAPLRCYFGSALVQFHGAQECRRSLPYQQQRRSTLQQLQQLVKWFRSRGFYKNVDM